MSKLVLITGVTGQDGSLMVDYLLKNTDHEVRGMVRRTAKPDLSNLKDVLNNPRFQLVVGDLTDSQSIENLVRELKPDYFINFAAQSFVGSSWQIPLTTVHTDTMGVVYCLEAIRNFAPQCRFYNAGSSEEFGDVVYSPQDEKHPLNPQSPYGAAKAAARHFVRVYRQSYNLYAIQGYLFNHEGVRRGEEFVTRKITKGVARIAKAIKEGAPFEPLELGNLDAKRDWSDAEDFIDGVWRMLNQDIYGLMRTREIFPGIAVGPAPGPVEYVLSSNETHSIREFVEEAFKVVGIDIQWSGYGKSEVGFSTEIHESNGQGWTDTHYLVRINPKFYRAAEVNLLHGDSSLARRELGWQPKTGFKELVRKMVLWDMEIINNGK